MSMEVKLWGPGVSWRWFCTEEKELGGVRTINKRFGNILKIGLDPGSSILLRQWPKVQNTSEGAISFLKGRMSRPPQDRRMGDGEDDQFVGYVGLSRNTIN